MFCAVIIFTRFRTHFYTVYVCHYAIGAAFGHIIEVKKLKKQITCSLIETFNFWHFKPSFLKFLLEFFLPLWYVGYIIAKVTDTALTLILLVKLCLFIKQDIYFFLRFIQLSCTPSRILSIIFQKSFQLVCNYLAHVFFFPTFTVLFSSVSFAVIILYSKNL